MLDEQINDRELVMLEREREREREILMIEILSIKVLKINFFKR